MQTARELINKNNLQPKRFISLIIFFSLLVAIDQITKDFFSSRDFFFGPIHFYLLKNYGLPFGLNFGEIINTILISLGLGYFVWYALNTKFDLGLSTRLGLALIISGAVGNIVDRVMLGFVRDFIDLGLGFSFNLADVYVFAGILFLLGEGLVPLFRKQ